MATAITRSPIVVPNAADRQLRCRCGHMDFGGHVRPLKRGGAVLQELVCRRCAFVLKIRPADRSLERAGETTDMEGETIR